MNAEVRANEPQLVHFAINENELSRHVGVALRAQAGGGWVDIIEISIGTGTSEELASEAERGCR